MYRMWSSWTFVCPCGIDVMADIIKAKEENKIYREGLNKLKADKLMYDEQIAQLKEKEKTASEEEKAEIKAQIKHLWKKKYQNYLLIKNLYNLI